VAPASSSSTSCSMPPPPSRSAGLTNWPSAPVSWAGRHRGGLGR
jgi:hypothetical protein